MKWQPIPNSQSQNCIFFTIPDALGQDVMRQAQLVKSLFELQREFILISTGYEFNDSPESGRHFTNPLGR